MNFLNITPGVMHILPEIIILTFALITIVIEPYTKLKRLIGVLGIFVLVLALTVLVISAYRGVRIESLFYGMLALDQFGIFFRAISIITSGVVILLSMGYAGLPKDSEGEYYSMLLFITAGMMLLVSSSNLLMIFLAIEFVSITSYILAGFMKSEPKSSEAALKYFLLGGLSSGVMLYGMSLLYGWTKSLDIMEIYTALNSGNIPLPLIIVSVTFLLAGFGFKIALVPFHMWTPDVYEGAPTPVAAFLSVGPKAAGFAVLIRVLLAGMGGDIQTHWVPILAGLSIFTMTIGNIVAIAQQNIKRLIAYSSIAHSGYILLGLVLSNKLGLEGILLYLLIYLFMNLGAFGVVIVVSNSIKSDEIKDYAGLSQRSPLLALALAVFLVSLSGIPPTAGFVGKFYIFAACIEGGYAWLAVIAIINSIIAAYYYFKIVRVMYLVEAKDSRVIAGGIGSGIALFVTLVLTIIIGVYPGPFISLVERSIHILGM